MTIPLVDLKRQYERIKDEIDEAIQEVLQDSRFILGPHGKRLEEDIAAYHSTGYAVGVASGTDALVLSLAACDIGPGDEVITTPFTFIATAEAISRVGARPVFCDIDEKTYNLNPDKIEEKITDATRAVIPVHLYGLPCDMDSIVALAKKHNLKVIEDCAQSFGGEYKGKKVGSLGDMGCLSFFPGKNLGAYGDAGMVVTSDEEIAKKLMILRNHGSDVKYYYGMHGFNSRLDNIQAAVLLVKLRYIDNWVEERRTNAMQYNRMLSDRDVAVPAVPDFAGHCFNYYTIDTKGNRPVLMDRLKENGIAHAIYYPLCLHLQQIYRDLGYKKGDFPVAEKAQDNVLSLPMFAELTNEEIEAVCHVIR